MTFPDLLNKQITIPDVISFKFNASGFKIADLSLDQSCKLMELHDDRFVFAFRNFTGNFKLDYMYISDPPIFADIGDFELDIANTTFLLDVDPNVVNGVLDVDIHRLELDIDPFRVEIDGVSDISDVSTRFITFVGNVIRSRLVSVLAYAGPERINPMVNKILAMIPDEKNIPGTQLYLEGGIADNFTITESGYMLLPLDISLQNYSVAFNRTNNVSFGPYVDHGY
jgi:hypothetical protein